MTKVSKIFGLVRNKTIVQKSKVKYSKKFENTYIPIKSQKQTKEKLKKTISKKSVTTSQRKKIQQFEKNITQNPDAYAPIDIKAKTEEIFLNQPELNKELFPFVLETHENAKQYEKETDKFAEEYAKIITKIFLLTNSLYEQRLLSALPQPTLPIPTTPPSLPVLFTPTPIPTQLIPFRIQQPIDPKLMLPQILDPIERAVSYNVSVPLLEQLTQEHRFFSEIVQQELEKAPHGVRFTLEQQLFQDTAQESYQVAKTLDPLSAALNSVTNLMRGLYGYDVLKLSPEMITAIVERFPTLVSLFSDEISTTLFQSEQEAIVAPFLVMIGSKTEGAVLFFDQTRPLEKIGGEFQKLVHSVHQLVKKELPTIDEVQIEEFEEVEETPESIEIVEVPEKVEMPKEKEEPKPVVEISEEQKKIEQFITPPQELERLEAERKLLEQEKAEPIIKEEEQKIEPQKEKEQAPSKEELEQLQQALEEEKERTRALQEKEQQYAIERAQKAEEAKLRETVLHSTKELRESLEELSHTKDQLELIKNQFPEGEIKPIFERAEKELVDTSNYLAQQATTLETGTQKEQPLEDPEDFVIKTVTETKKRVQENLSHLKEDLDYIKEKFPLQGELLTTEEEVIRNTEKLREKIIQNLDTTTDVVLDTGENLEQIRTSNLPPPPPLIEPKQLIPIQKPITAPAKPIDLRLEEQEEILNKSFEQFEQQLNRRVEEGSAQAQNIIRETREERTEITGAIEKNLFSTFLENAGNKISGFLAQAKQDIENLTKKLLEKKQSGLETEQKLEEIKTNTNNLIENEVKKIDEKISKIPVPKESSKEVEKILDDTLIVIESEAKKMVGEFKNEVDKVVDRETESEQRELLENTENQIKDISQTEGQLVEITNQLPSRTTTEKPLPFEQTIKGSIEETVQQIKEQKKTTDEIKNQPLSTLEKNEQLLKTIDKTKKILEEKRKNLETATNELEKLPEQKGKSELLELTKKAIDAMHVKEKALGTHHTKNISKVVEAKQLRELKERSNRYEQIRKPEREKTERAQKRLRQEKEYRRERRLRKRESERTRAPYVPRPPRWEAGRERYGDRFPFKPSPFEYEDELTSVESERLSYEQRAPFKPDKTKFKEREKEKPKITPERERIVSPTEPEVEPEQFGPEPITPPTREKPTIPPYGTPAEKVTPTTGITPSGAAQGGTAVGKGAGVLGGGGNGRIGAKKQLLWILLIILILLISMYLGRRYIKKR